ncbi:hypothetical protein ACP3TJ_03305 [Desulforudis sp. 1088]|uniref:hypothetical protein n=1 Tax=unclassified Candidatus Desulforudis TaxID=2635950 RepID=UPI003CE46256
MEMVRVQHLAERKNNYPVNAQDYCVGQAEDGRWFFTWGYRWPSGGLVPGEDVEHGQNGIHWHAGEQEALDDMNEAIMYFDADDGGYNPYEQNDLYWPEAY